MKVEVYGVKREDKELVLNLLNSFFAYNEESFIECVMLASCPAIRNVTPNRLNEMDAFKSYTQELLGYEVCPRVFEEDSRGYTLSRRIM